MTFNEELQGQIKFKIEGQGHKTPAFVALPIYTHIPNLKGLTKIFFKLSRPKGNLCGGGVTILNPKYPGIQLVGNNKVYDFRRRRLFNGRVLKYLGTS